MNLYIRSGLVMMGCLFSFHQSTFAAVYSAISQDLVITTAMKRQVHIHWSPERTVFESGEILVPMKLGTVFIVVDEASTDGSQIAVNFSGSTSTDPDKATMVNNIDDKEVLNVALKNNEGQALKCDRDTRVCPLSDGGKIIHEVTLWTEEGQFADDGEYSATVNALILNN